MLFFSVVALAEADSKAIQVNIDELKIQLDKLPAQDRRRLPLLTELVKSTRRSAPELAISYAQQGIAILEVHPWDEQRALLLGYLAKIYLERSQFDYAEQLITQGLSAAKASKNPLAITTNGFNQAILYQLTNRLVLALDSYQAIADSYLKANNLSQLASTYNNIGTVHRELGNMEQALSYFQKALPFYPRENAVHAANTTMNIGQIFHFLGDYEQAEASYIDGLALITQQSAPLSFIEGHERLGMLFREQQQYEKSKYHLQIAVDIASKYQLGSAQIETYFEQILLANKAQDIDYMNTALANAEELLTSYSQLETLWYVDYFRALVATANQDWESAESYIDTLFKNEIYQPRYFKLQDALNLAFTIKNHLGKAQQANTMAQTVFKNYQLQHKKTATLSYHNMPSYIKPIKKHNSLIS